MACLNNILPSILTHAPRIPIALPSCWQLTVTPCRDRRFVLCAMLPDSTFSDIISIDSPQIFLSVAPWVWNVYDSPGAWQ
jgi:hypothetical protein